ncbi:MULTISPECIES: hypothetical protein [Actinoplanes]|nr:MULTISPECIES: hypothetical protein [Actinoplanes]GLY06980.1 hypothetical protein Acsp01_73590 [Actinoplanes sp. NBRC 101535]
MVTAGALVLVAGGVSAATVHAKPLRAEVATTDQVLAKPLRAE